MRSLRFRTGSDSTTSTRSSGITHWLRRRPVVLALTLVSISACGDASDPLRPEPGAAVPAGPAMSLAQTLSGCDGAAPLRTIQADSSTYRSLITGLLPGDRLLLAAGTYTQGLPLWNKNGEPGKCIVIEGPASGSPALFTGSDSWNLVSLKDASYIAVRNLTLDGLGKGGDGVKAEATAVSVHHILIEGLSLRNFNQDLQIVGISTKCPAWNWVVRNNTITSTGTGMYFGNSDGAAETANFLVEHNLVYNTLGYNVQFKHQLSRNTSIGMPSSGTTIIRHNTFSKASGSLSGINARTNLLVGHWPLSGAGSTDIYQIYGNVIYENPYEGLFQGEGNLAFHDNLLVNRTSDGVNIQPHNSVPRRIDIYNNTVVVGSGNGIRIAGADPAYTQRVVGNAVFAPTPLTGGQQSNNVTGTYAAASTYLNNPMAALGSGLDLYPKTGQLQGTAIDYSVFGSLEDRDRDFNGSSRVATYRGAYSGDGVNPGWTPALAIKPEPSGGNPPPPSGTLQNGVPVSGISGGTGSQQSWTISVPAGASNLKFQASGGTGDADLYVRFGSAPTTTTYDCRPFAGDNNETCTFAFPAAGTWHVLLVGDDPYSGVTLAGSYQTAPTTLQNGVPIGVSGAAGSQQGWTMNVPSGASNLKFQTSGGTGDADLYVRFGSAPTATTYDCRPFASNNNETCSFASPSAGTWYVLLVGDDPYSGATLAGSYQTGSPALQNGVPVSGISGAQGSQQFWTINVPAGASNLQFQTSGGSGDADLYVRLGSAPTTSTYDCKSDGGSNAETCSITSPAAGTWHVLVHGYAAYSGATLVGSYQVCNSISDVEPNDSRTGAQVISGGCNQVSGTFLNDATTQQNDYFRLSVPAGKTVTALLNGLTVDYDLYIYSTAGQVASSTNGDTTADQTSWTNTGASAVNVDILVWRYSSTRTTYQLKVSY